jgi:hypothetical protein
MSPPSWKHIAPQHREAVLRGLEKAALAAEKHAATFASDVNVRTFHVELAKAFRAAVGRLNEVDAVAVGDVPPGYVPDDKITSGDVLDVVAGMARAFGMEIPPRRR